MSLVELYYSDTCADCHYARSMLLEMLPKGITFKEMNIMYGEGAEKARLLDISSVPTVTIDGDVVLAGRIDRDDIKDALDSIITEKVSYWTSTFTGI